MREPPRTARHRPSPSHLLTPSLSPLPPSAHRRLPLDLGVHQRRRHDHQRCLPRRRERHQVLQQAGLRLVVGRQLPLGLGLRGHLGVQPVPGPLVLQVLLVVGPGLGRLRHPELPVHVQRLQAGRHRRRQEDRRRLARSGPRDRLHQAVRLRIRQRPLLRQGHRHDVLGCGRCKFLFPFCWNLPGEEKNCVHHGSRHAWLT